MKYRVGIVGAGHISEFHLRALSHLESVQIVGVFDVDTNQAARGCREFGGQCFETLDDLLAETPDVVHVLTPPATHAAIILRCLDAGCHVFSEKPLTTSVEDADRIAEVAAAAQKTVGVDHSLLGDPFTQKALRIVKSGRIGEVLNVCCERSQDWPPYAGGPLPVHYGDAGYPFRDLGIHALYQIEAFLGEITDASWSFHHLGKDSNLMFDDWHMTVRCKRGTGHVHLSWNTRPIQDAVTIHGTRGTVHIDRFGMNVTVTRMNRLPEHPRRAWNAMCRGLQITRQVPVNLTKIVFGKIRRYHGVHEMVADFYQALEQQRSPLATAQDARRIGYWIEQVAGEADRFKENISRRRQSEPLRAKILVTGGTGLIGRHLVHRLLHQSDDPIRLFCRREPPDEWKAHPQIEITYGDLGDPAAVQNAVQGIDTIFHVGGTVHGEHHDFQRGNVAATQNIVAAAVEQKISQLVYISSLSVLQSATFSLKQSIEENWPLEPNPGLRGAYTQTKLDAELIVRQAVEDQQLPAVILRPGEVIGSGAPLLSPGVAKKIGRTIIVFGDGKSPVPLIHVEDVVDAMLLAKEKGIRDGSIYHLVDDQQLSQNELIRRYANAMNEEYAVWYLPRWFLLVASGTIDFAFRLLRRTSPVTPYRFRSALAKRRFDCEKAKRELGWQARHGIDDGLRATFAVMDNQPSTTNQLTSMSSTTHQATTT